MKYANLLVIFSLIITITRSQPPYNVDYVRIESINFLTNKYEENTSKDHRALGDKWNLFSYYQEIKEVDIINYNKIRNVILNNDNINEDNRKFYILESFTENTEPCKITMPDLIWNVYKLKSKGNQPTFVSLCNFKNDLIAIYNAFPIRVFFIFKNSQFKTEEIELPEYIYSLNSVQQIDALGKGSRWINLTFDLQSLGKKVEYFYLFKNHVIFNPNHAREQSYNDANKDYYNKLLLDYNYEAPSESPNNSVNSEANQHIIEEKPGDVGKLIISISKNAHDKANIDYITASEFLRYDAKKIPVLNNISKTDILYYSKVLNSINSNYLQNVINGHISQNTVNNNDFIPPPKDVEEKLIASNDVEEKKDNIEDKIIDKPEIEASFPGGPGAWAKYMQRAIEANQDEFTKSDHGTCIVKFIVDKTGRVSEVEATTMKGSKLAEVATNAIRKGPNWTPAQQNGRYVNAYRLQPVTLFDNEATEDNGYRNQGYKPGNGDAESPDGKPDAYGNSSGGRSGVSVVRGLSGRRPIHFPSMTDDFNESAKVYVDIKVNAGGKVTDAGIARGTTTSNSSLRSIAIEKAKELKFPPSQNDVESGTILFVFVSKN